MQQFKTRSCKGCPVKQLCTKNPKGRLIERTEYTPYMVENQRKIEQNKEVYKQRQSIVEHPYGTIKRQWGFYYILSKKGIARASADVGLMLTAYNLRRLINILGMKEFFKILNIIVLRFSEFFRAIQRKISIYLAVRATLNSAVKNVKHLVFTTIFGKNLAVQTGL